MLELYKNIKNRRLELGMTQSDLAKKLGYSDKSMIAKIEKGIVDLSQSKITAFSQALQTSESELMGWNDKPAPTTDSSPDFSDVAGRNRIAVDSVMDIVNQYGTDTPEQRAALSAALNAVDIPVKKRELLQRILRMEPEQVAAFLAMAQQMPQ